MSKVNKFPFIPHALEGMPRSTAASVQVARCRIEHFGGAFNFFQQLSVLIESKFSAFCGERASHARFPNFLY